MLLLVGRAALRQRVGTTPEECTGVEGGTEHTLKDTPRGRYVLAPRTRREMERSIEHGATKA